MNIRSEVINIRTFVSVLLEPKTLDDVELLKNYGFNDNESIKFCID